MKLSPERAARFAVMAVVLTAAGCLSPEEIRRIESGPEGSGLQFSRLPEIIRYMASYDATPVQRQGAQRQAEAIVAKMNIAPAAKTQVAASPAPSPAPEEKKVATPAARPAAPQEPGPAAAPPPAKPVAASERYIAVAVPRDERAQGRASVMIWDINSSDFVSNKVYDIAAPPAPRTKVRWEVGTDLLVVNYQGGASVP